MSFPDMSELEQAIMAGWSDRRLEQLPLNWRKLKPTPVVSDFWDPKPTGIDPDAFGAMCNQTKRIRTPRPLKPIKPQSQRRIEYLRESGKMA
jgi:hypothetical protein